jgi:hypothetical protein
MLPPLPRHGNERHCIAHPSRRVSLPRIGGRVGLRIVLFEVCSAFTRVAACTLARPPNRGSLTRRLQPLRFLRSCSGASGWSSSPGGPLTHWKAPPYHGARQLQTCMVFSAFFCNSEEAGVEGPAAASAFALERQTSKESPYPHHQASMRNLAATTADLNASSRRCVPPQRRLA